MKRWLGRVKSRQETFFSRVKSFKIMKNRFRHGKRGTADKLLRHKHCFESVVVLLAYDIEHNPLFDVYNIYLFNIPSPLTILFSCLTINLFRSLFPLRTLGCIYSSLVCTESCSEVLFADIALCILPLELFNRIVMSEIGRDH